MLVPLRAGRLLAGGGSSVKRRAPQDVPGHRDKARCIGCGPRIPGKRGSAFLPSWFRHYRHHGGIEDPQGSWIELRALERATMNKESGWVGGGMAVGAEVADTGYLSCTLPTQSPF